MDLSFIYSSFNRLSILEHNINHDRSHTPSGFKSIHLNYYCYTWYINISGNSGMILLLLTTRRTINLVAKQFVLAKILWAWWMVDRAMFYHTYNYTTHYYLYKAEQDLVSSCSCIRNISRTGLCSWGLLLAIFSLALKGETQGSVN